MSPKHSPEPDAAHHDKPSVSPANGDKSHVSGKQQSAGQRRKSLPFLGTPTHSGEHTRLVLDEKVAEYLKKSESPRNIDQDCACE